MFCVFVSNLSMVLLIDLNGHFFPFLLYASRALGHMPVLLLHSNDRRVVANLKFGAFGQNLARKEVQYNRIYQIANQAQLRYFNVLINRFFGI